MFINKNNVKRVLATTVAIVTTGLPSIANASFYKVSDNENIYDICNKVYGNGNYFGEIIEHNEIGNGNIYDGMYIDLPEFEELKGINSNIKYDEFDGIGIDCDENGNILGAYVPVKDGYAYVNTIGNFNMNVAYENMLFNFDEVVFTKISGITFDLTNGSVIMKVPTNNGNIDLKLNCISTFNCVVETKKKNSADDFVPTVAPTITPKPTITPTMVPTITPVITPSIMYVESPADRCLRYLGSFDSYLISENLKVVDGNITCVYLKANNSRGFVTVTDYNNKIDFESIDYDYYINGEITLIRFANKVYAIGIKRFDCTYDYIVLDSSLMDSEDVRSHYNHSTEAKTVVDRVGSSNFNNYNYNNNNNYSFDYSNNYNYDYSDNDFDYSNDNDDYDFSYDNNNSYSAYEDYATSAPTVNPNDKDAVKADIITRSNLEIIGDETMWYLCKKYYNNGNYYKKVLKFNGYKESKKLTRGTKIYFPPLEELLDYFKRFKSENNNVYVKKLHA